MRKPLAAMAALITVLVLAAPVSAHVTVNPKQVPKGGFSTLAFKVPNERDDSGTTKLEVVFPTDHPIAFVSVRPHAGWTHSVEKKKLATPVEVEGTEITEAVTKITWTATSDDAVIGPGEFDQFEVSAGPLPDDVDELVFKALQTYESGEVVRWIEEASPGGEEPEHPAPVLALVVASDGRGNDGTAAGDDTDEQGTPDSAAEELATKREVGSIRALAIVGLVFGLLAFLIAGRALAQQRQST